MRVLDFTLNPDHFSGYSGDEDDDCDSEDELDIPQKSTLLNNVNDSVVVNYDRLLGKGAHGTVYEGWFGKKRTAVKLLKGGPFTTKRFQREKRIMTEFQSESTIVRLLGLVDPFGLVIDFMENGDLNAFLQKNHLRLTLDHLLKIALGISVGLKTLHSRGFLHGDVCPGNVLIDEKLCPVLCDFGLTRPPMEDPRCFGNPVYSAPEGFFGKFYSEKSDVFSFGMVLHHIFFPPSPQTHPKRFLRNKKSLLTKKGSLLDLFSFPENPNAILRSVVCSCLNTEPNARPSCFEIYRVVSSLFSCPS
mmetsp:Transcript_5209/g.6624  ORF Transcript_5209/g.6624 Transcript_5209/m.6624 type:complete len:303 (+) Transcript_5209:39-947(+)